MYRHSEDPRSAFGVPLAAFAMVRVGDESAAGIISHDEVIGLIAMGPYAERGDEHTLLYADDYPSAELLGYAAPGESDDRQWDDMAARRHDEDQSEQQEKAMEQKP